VKYVELYYPEFSRGNMGKLHIPVTVTPLQAWTDPYGSRGLRLPEFVDNWHVKVVTLSALSTNRHYVSFLLEAKTSSAKRSE